MSKSLSTRAAAKKLKVSRQRIRQWCAEGRIPGAVRIKVAGVIVGWEIPPNAERPADARRKTA